MPTPLVGDASKGDDLSRITLAQDYEATFKIILLLSDVRFRLLALVPLIAGGAVALLTKTSDQMTALAVGAVGLAANVGILLYELRNSQLYNAAMHRAKHLEASARPALTLTRRPIRRCQPGLEPSVVLWPQAGGVINERTYVPRQCERGFRLFGLLTVKHDRGLALVYSAALGAWAYLIVHAILVLSWQDTHLTGLLAVIPAVGFATLVALEVTRHDGSAVMKPEPPGSISQIDATVR
jgi:hypothetical protein